MTSQTTTARTYFLLVVENGKPRIVAASPSWGEMVDRQVALEDERHAAGTPAANLYYAVREIDDAHGLVRTALDSLRLTEKQTKVLVAITDGGGASRRGFRPNGGSVAGYYSTDIVPTARALEARGLVFVRGTKGAPKTYYVSKTGAAIAAAIA